MTKLFIILCLSLLASVSFAFGTSFLSGIAKAPSEGVSLASTTLLSDGLGDCIVFTCPSGTSWQACCPHAGVYPQNCNCAYNPPICYCYGNAE